MRAAVAERFGPPDVLDTQSVADPVPREGEVIVEVQYSGISFVDTQLRAGRPPNPATMPSPPLIPANGVGGVVVPAVPVHPARFSGVVSSPQWAEPAATLRLSPSTRST